MPGTVGRLGLAANDALEALPPETVDATLVKKLINHLAGGSFMPELADLADGVKAGLISTAAS